MNILGIKFKREYIVHYREPEDVIWFYKEPRSSKKELQPIIQFLKEKKAEIKVSTRYTIEI